MNHNCSTMISICVHNAMSSGKLMFMYYFSGVLTYFCLDTQIQIKPNRFLILILVQVQGWQYSCLIISKYLEKNKVSYKEGLVQDSEMAV